ncbi:MAG: RtcB family protein [Bacteroidetes bacterium]|nr:RtcB family protein [Bacteroidota bacterium]
MAKKIRGNHLVKIGFPQNRSIGIALEILQKHFRGNKVEEGLELLTQVLKNPEHFREHESMSRLAEYFIDNSRQIEESRKYRLVPAKSFAEFGSDQIDEGARNQMFTAMKLPITIDGALMPDAHHGYGLPIGGVLATRNAIIPYGVGVDIGCRMCLTVFNDPLELITQKSQQLSDALNKNTRFGNTEVFERPSDHSLFDRPEFREISVAKKLFNKARIQIGSSGGGNHFVEFGRVTITDKTNELGLIPGEYLGLLSHSGSRGLGAGIASYYSRIAEYKCQLPGEARKLAWLDLDSEAGQEYWLAMNLAGDYASACHHDIHQRIERALKLSRAARVENHHNFAWKEKSESGEELIVHRKGATPAGKGVLGVIPGSMTQPGFIVRGRGEVSSLQSASHGAGRLMSRSKAKSVIGNAEMKEVLTKHNILLSGGGVDESPMVYKDIHSVMNAQSELVDILGSFHPAIVRMAMD